eukprot:scaffold706_cov418-Prasinococcus_capsulatus_cf.AAC.19
MNDLLGSVRGVQDVEEGIGRRRRVETDEHDDAEIGHSGTGPEGATKVVQVSSLQDFFAAVSTIKASLASVKRSLRLLQQQHHDSKTLTRPEDMRELRDEMYVTKTVANAH